MSNSNSGSSTPRSGATPPPAGVTEGPSPLTVGTRFVKQYYKVLSTEPDQIVRFYQPTSVLSHGVASQPTQPVLFEKIESVLQLKDRFYLGEEICPIRFELEHGAIDAQQSINGGVLLVVTGHIVYLQGDYDEEDAVERRKAFVHTFFLGSLTAGAKRSYYVHNDVLRFLHDDEEKTVIISNTTANSDTKEPTVDIVIPDEKPVEVVAANGVDHVDGFGEAPGGGVEETKEPVLQDEREVELPEVAVQEEVVVVEKVEEVVEIVPVVVEEEIVVEPEQAPAPSVETKKPDSWASLVKSGTPSSSSTPSTPVRPTPAAKPASNSKPKVSPAPAANSAPAPPASDVAGNRSGPMRQVKGDPDFTLVIKNIAEGITEAEVLALFEPLAATSDSKVVNSKLLPHKGIAFIDYDSVAPVLAALEQHQKAAYKLKDRELDIQQKTTEQRGRPKAGRGPFRGGEPSNGKSGGGGGGRPLYRKGGSGRADRGGRGGGRGGGR